MYDTEPTPADVADDFAAFYRVLATGLPDYDENATTIQFGAGVEDALRQVLDEIADRPDGLRRVVFAAATIHLESLLKQYPAEGLPRWLKLAWMQQSARAAELRAQERSGGDGTDDGDDDAAG